MATEFGFDAATVHAFDLAYALSKPPAVQALYAGSIIQNGADGRPLEPIDPFVRYQIAVDLVKQGFLIDDDIDAHGADPYLTMFARKFVEGDTWVPSAGMGLQLGPFTGAPPQGAIKVSVDLADYPPFTPPPPPETPMSGPLVGSLIFGGMYGLTKLASDLYAQGKLPPATSQDGKSFKLVVNQWIIGTQIFWELS